MDRRLLTVIFFLLIVGLAGLSALQLVWLRNAVNHSEVDFDQLVYESLDEIALLIQDLEYQPIIEEMMQSMPEDSTSAGSGAEAALQDSAIAQQDLEELKERMDQQEKELKQMMLREMLSKRSIAEIIDTTRLHTLIGQVLTTKGIRTDFHFGITEESTNNFVLVSPQADLRQLYKTPYIVKIYSRTFFDSNRFLLLQFPDRRAYLFQAFGKLILSSGFFIILLILAFALAIHIIFRQKRLSDMKTDFINNMTHELKTPIATISLASEMLRDNSISASEVNRQKYAHIIQDENKRLASHVERVLQIARLEKGEIELDIVPAHIHEFIEAVADNFSLLVKNKGGALEIQLLAEQDEANIDEMHFASVITNLLDNALKYNDKKPQIAVKTYNADNGLYIEVSDNGIGISRDDQKRIFEKFYRVSTGNLHDVKGFGLGLSYVKSIVERLNGKIFVQSKTKEGSTFKIYLPQKTVK